MTRPSSHDASLAPNAPASGSTALRLALALGWLAMFSIWFYSFGMPNNRPLQRWMIWSMIPFDLMDLLDPPVEPNAPAWGWLYLGQRIPFATIALGVWLAALAVGRLELRWLRVCSLLDRAERSFFAICLGLATISLLMLGLGLAGQLTRWPLVIILSVAGAFEVWQTIQDRRRSGLSTANLPSRLATRSAKKIDAKDEPGVHWVPWVVLVAVTPFVFCLLLGAMSPQTDFDVIEYHLGGPKEWFQQGRIVRLPHNVYTSFPFLSEMLLLSGMVLYGDWNSGALAGQAIIAGFAPLTALGLYATGRRWFSANAGALGALIWLTTPWAYRISIIAYAEGGLACYMFASLAVGLRILWFTSDEPRVPEENGSPQPTLVDVPQGLSLLAGLLAGSAMACKYTGLISAVLPGAALIAGAAMREPDRRGKYLLRGLAVFAVGVGLAIGPWLLKNTLETGNPVYPLAWSIFGGDGRDAAMNAQWRQGHSSHYKRPLDRVWDLPVKVTDVMANNDWHSDLMFALAPIAWLAIWRRKVWCVWAFIGWQFLSWFLFTHHIDRFYVPMFPAVALLAGAGAAWLVRFRAASWCCGLLIVLSILFNAEVMQIQGVTGFNAGRMDLHAAAEMVTPPSQRWLNDEFAAGRLPSDFKLLCVGEAALFHARFPYVYNTVFDRSRFEQWFAERTASGDFQLRPADQIRQTLREHGITHVLVNWAEILRYREPGSYGYTDFAHPDWFAKLQAAGILGPPLPLPERIALHGIGDKKHQQVADWAPSLLVPTADRTELRAVQIFPVRY